MAKEHHYKLTTLWRGNTGTGRSSYRAYERSITVEKQGKADIHCTSDTAFNSAKTKHNPEELLLAAISSCHLLWYLHLCSEAGVVVNEYVDNATATMIEVEDGSGHFTGVILYPTIVISEEGIMEKAMELHKSANRLCYIANSCNFPIHHKPTIQAATKQFLRPSIWFFAKQSDLLLVRQFKFRPCEAAQINTCT